MRKLLLHAAPIPAPSCPDERALVLTGRVTPLAALRFNAGARHRVLALHGWLDNAMSFAPLAAHLPDCDIVALDLPGHGHSGHLPAHHWYHFVDYLDDALDAMDALGWDRCHVLGHSMGGAIASLLAAACPQRVDTLLLIEALGPLAASPGKAAQSLRQSLTERRRSRRSNDSRPVPSMDIAVTARLKASPMHPDNARLLMARNLRESADGLHWRSDLRLRIGSPLRADEATITEWIAAIEAPTQVILADTPSSFFTRELITQRLTHLRNGRSTRLPGDHHLHMDDPARSAEAIQTMLGID